MSPHLGGGEKGGEVVDAAGELGPLPAPPAAQHVLVTLRLQQVHPTHLIQRVWIRVRVLSLRFEVWFGLVWFGLVWFMVWFGLV